MGLRVDNRLVEYLRPRIDPWLSAIRRHVGLAAALVIGRLIGEHQQENGRIRQGATY
jgi:hypothetical protein